MIRIKAWFRLIKLKWTQPKTIEFGTSDTDYEITDFDHTPLIPWLAEERE